MPGTLDHKKKTTKADDTHEDPPFLREKLKDCNPHCAAELRALYRTSNELAKGNINKMWENGQRIENLRSNKSHSRSKDGSTVIDPVQKAAEILDCTPGYCNKMAQLFRAFNTKAKLDKLLARRFPRTGKPVTWYHMEQLLKLYVNEGSNEVFEEYLDRTFENDWDPSQIDQAIKSLRRTSGLTESRGGGRPVHIPATFHGRATRLISQTGVLAKNTTEIYDNPAYNFLASVEGMGQEEVADKADELLDLVNKMRDNLATVQAMCDKKLRDELPAVEAYINKCAKAKTEAEAKAAAEALETADAVA